MKKQETLLFLGDCNTLGPGEIKGQAYPEQLCQKISARPLNCGHTMSTTREGLNYFTDFYTHNKARDDISVIAIQYGLVDAWETFKYSPYVLYYPDSPLRKLGRKLAKKYKKWCRKLGLNKLIGTRNVVELYEYVENIRFICREARNIPVVLIETVPNKDKSRNQAIREYNQALVSLSQEEPNCSVLRVYEDFDSELACAYIDPTHIDFQGHEYIANRLHAHLNSILPNQ